MDQQEMTVTQFGSSAEYYLSSAVHAAGADLERLAALVSDNSGLRALDLGCGEGLGAGSLRTIRLRKC